MVVVGWNKQPTSQLRNAYNAECTLQSKGVCIVETVFQNAQDVKLQQQKKIASTAENVNCQNKKNNR